jgi:molybdopterin molybdotransferase
MGLLPVAEAVQKLLAGIEPLAAETVPLDQASGRVLADDLKARLTQPPFAASAMDGYALRAAEAKAGARLKVIGMSRAGARFSGSLGPGEAVRIFTGAPVPDGADSVLIQENASRDGDTLEVLQPVAPGRNIRSAGLDFKRGDAVLPANRVLGPHAISLAASTGYATLPVRRKPRVAILANGDELVPPGATPGPD